MTSLAHDLNLQISKSKDFDLFSNGSKFTDDTVLTVAIADAILQSGSYREFIHRYGNAYRGRGYGNRFFEWLCAENPAPYGSYGNGSAMRVSSVGFAFDSLNQILEEGKKRQKLLTTIQKGLRGLRR